MDHEIRQLQWQTTDIPFTESLQMEWTRRDLKLATSYCTWVATARHLRSQQARQACELETGWRVQESLVGRAVLQISDSMGWVAFAMAAEPLN